MGKSRLEIQNYLTAPLKNGEDCGKKIATWAETLISYLEYLKDIINTGEYTKNDRDYTITNLQVDSRNNSHNLWYQNGQSDLEKMLYAYGELIIAVKRGGQSSNGFNKKEIDLIEEIADYLLLRFKALAGQKISIDEEINKLVEEKAVSKGEVQNLKLQLNEHIIKAVLGKKFSKEQLRTIINLVKNNNKIKEYSRWVTENSCDSFAAAYESAKGM